jgi:hypothetical protein
MRDTGVKPVVSEMQDRQGDRQAHDPVCGQAAYSRGERAHTGSERLELTNPVDGDEHHAQAVLGGHCVGE